MTTRSAKPDLRTIGIRDVVFGDGVTVVEPANLYGCEIGANSFVGPFVEIQSGVRIGSGCRIQSHSFICEMVTIGDDSTVAHGVMFINDPFTNGGPARGDQTAWRETVIGDRVSIGSNATILPVNICSDVVIGAGSVVTHNIIESGVYAGNPARKIR
jgi:acetyltransferase-like isoleucine patch superfamily enzyme